MKNKEQIISLITTFASDFAYEILLGLAAIIETGDITFVALSAVFYAGFRHAFRMVAKKFISTDERST